MIKLSPSEITLWSKVAVAVASSSNANSRSSMSTWADAAVMALRARIETEDIKKGPLR